MESVDPHVVNRTAHLKDRIRRKLLLHSGVVCGTIGIEWGILLYYTTSTADKSITNVPSLLYSPGFCDRIQSRFSFLQFRNHNVVCQNIRIEQSILSFLRLYPEYIGINPYNPCFLSGNNDFRAVDRNGNMDFGLVQIQYSDLVLDAFQYCHHSLLYRQQPPGCPERPMRHLKYSDTSVLSLHCFLTRTTREPSSCSAISSI